MIVKQHKNLCVSSNRKGKSWINASSKKRRQRYERSSRGLMRNQDELRSLTSSCRLKERRINGERENASLCRFSANNKSKSNNSIVNS